VPEVALKAGYQVAPQWRILVGYDVMYWTEVQRSGGLIDTTINPNLIPPGRAGTSAAGVQHLTTAGGGF